MSVMSVLSCKNFRTRAKALAGNLSDEGGNLVFEIVCRFKVTQADAKAACQGYSDKVTLPPVGSHVRIVGTYVQDTFHAKWMEIHPVTSITVIP